MDQWSPPPPGRVPRRQSHWGWGAWGGHSGGVGDVDALRPFLELRPRLNVDHLPPSHPDRSAANGGSERKARPRKPLVGGAQWVGRRQLREACLTVLARRPTSGDEGSDQTLYASLI
eukprot:SAG11_NODE_6454_length_1310_cov_1.210570_1_plen_117_part_00